MEELAGCTRLGELVCAASTASRDFGCSATDTGEMLAPYVAAALGEQHSSCSSGRSAATAAPQQRGAPLAGVLAAFGWCSASGSFTRPLDATAFSARLKAYCFCGLRPMGAGAYAVCYAATHRVTGQRVVLKRMRLDRGDHQGVPSTALREVSLLRELSTFPNIVR